MSQSALDERGYFEAEGLASGLAYSLRQGYKFQASLGFMVSSRPHVNNENNPQQTKANPCRKRNGWEWEGDRE